MYSEAILTCFLSDTSADQPENLLVLRMQVTANKTKQNTDGASYSSLAQCLMSEIRNSCVFQYEK